MTSPYHAKHFAHELTKRCPSDSVAKLAGDKRQLDAKRDEAWKEYELAAREIEAKKDTLMDEVEKRLQQQVSENELFTIRWRVG